MATKWTTPAPKYGPTGDYGECEADGCEAEARMTCSHCAGQFCLGHADVPAHDPSALGDGPSDERAG